MREDRLRKDIWNTEDLSGGVLGLWSEIQTKNYNEDKNMVKGSQNMKTDKRIWL